MRLCILRRRRWHVVFSALSIMLTASGSPCRRAVHNSRGRFRAQDSISVPNEAWKQRDCGYAPPQIFVTESGKNLTPCQPVVRGGGLTQYPWWVGSRPSRRPPLATTASRYSRPARLRHSENDLCEGGVICVRRGGFMRFEILQGYRHTARGISSPRTERANIAKGWFVRFHPPRQ